MLMGYTAAPGPARELAVDDQAGRQEETRAERTIHGPRGLLSFAFMTLANALHAQPKALLFAEALVLVALIGVLDSINGWDVSLFLFYAAPILLVVWFGDRRLAVLCAVVCGIAWFLANKDTHPYATSYAYVWVTFNRMAYFLFVA